MVLKKSLSKSDLGVFLHKKNPAVFKTEISPSIFGQVPEAKNYNFCSFYPFIYLCFAECIH